MLETDVAKCTFAASWHRNPHVIKSLLTYLIAGPAFALRVLEKLRELTVRHAQLLTHLVWNF